VVWLRAVEALSSNAGANKKSKVLLELWSEGKTSKVSPQPHHSTPPFHLESLAPTNSPVFITAKDQGI
jgi:hypothetical protein